MAIRSIKIQEHKEASHCAVMVRMVGTLWKGIHLIIHPLLVLSVGQVLRVIEGVIDYGSIEVHDLVSKLQQLLQLGSIS